MASQLFHAGSDKILHKMGKTAYLYDPCVPYILTPPLSVSTMLSFVPVSGASRSEKEGYSQFGWPTNDDGLASWSKNYHG